jgi:alanyl-tRNA synthetase
VTHPTRRLFHEDARLCEFEAEVLEVRPADGDGLLVRLDATAFYATSGGQPHDTGRLAGWPVVDVAAADDDALWHRLARPPAGNPTPAVGDRVTGILDWARRFDHMQQHTGQHVLSQAFVETARAETVSFHLGQDSVTIDLSRGDLADSELRRAEARANEVVVENRAIRTHWTTRDELHRFPLRKPPVVDGPIRIVEVADFDFSACGGTHVAATGEIGLIKLLGREKVKQGTRVSFLCGGRALADYAWKHDLVRTTAERFSTLDRKLGESIERLEEEAAQLRRRLKVYEEERLDREADALASRTALDEAGRRLLVVVRPGASMEELKGLSSRLVTRPGMAVFLAATENEKTQLLFARAADVSLDAGALLREVVTPRGGRGGGRPEAAQGGVPGTLRADELEAAIRALLPGLA